MYSAFLDDGSHAARVQLTANRGRQDCAALPSAHLLLTHHGCDITDLLTPKAFGLFYLQTLARSPADTKALWILQKKPTEQLTPCSTDLGSALTPSSPLVQQLFLSRAPMSLCQPFAVAICMSAALCSSTNTVQNTSFPTKCLHRANLHYNYFLVPITEALKDEYKSHSHVLWHYIRCEGI